MYPVTTPPNRSIQKIGSFFEIWQKNQKMEGFPLGKVFHLKNLWDGIPVCVLWILVTT